MMGIINNGDKHTMRKELEAYVAQHDNMHLQFSENGVARISVHYLKHKRGYELTRDFQVISATIKQLINPCPVVKIRDKHKLGFDVHIEPAPKPQGKDSMIKELKAYVVQHEEMTMYYRKDGIAEIVVRYGDFQKIKHFNELSKRFDELSKHIKTLINPTPYVILKTFNHDGFSILVSQFDVSIGLAGKILPTQAAIPPLRHEKGYYAAIHEGESCIVYGSHNHFTDRGVEHSADEFDWISHTPINLQDLMPPIQARRKSGYYWVKKSNDSEWLPRRFDNDSKTWQDDVNDDYWHTINETQIAIPKRILTGE